MIEIALAYFALIIHINKSHAINNANILYIKSMYVPIV